MKVKNTGSDIYSVSLAQGGASKCYQVFGLFITIETLVHIRYVVTIGIRSPKV